MVLGFRGTTAVPSGFLVCLPTTPSSSKREELSRPPRTISFCFGFLVRYSSVRILGAALGLGTSSFFHLEKLNMVRRWYPGIKKLCIFKFARGITRDD